MNDRWTTTATAADDGVIDVSPPATTHPAGEPTRAEHGRATAFRRRFTAIYIALALVGGVGVGALVVVVAASSDAGPTVPQQWSSFVPRGSTHAKASAIARRVSQRYTLPSGAQLVGVIAGPPTWTVPQPEGSTQILIRAIAVQPDVPIGGQLSARDIETTDATNTVQYLLCGYGQHCEIPGEPSVPRDLLLRREALELALYTFRYLNGIKSVLVFLPPPVVNGQPVAAQVTLYLKRKDMSAYLAKPLNQTLDPARPREGELSAADAAAVNETTVKRRFQSRYIQAQDEGSVLLLDPVTTVP